MGKEKGSIRDRIPDIKQNISNIKDSIPDVKDVANMDFIGEIQDRKFHHFWDRHQVLSSVRALLFCTAVSALFKRYSKHNENGGVCYDGTADAGKRYGGGYQSRAGQGNRVPKSARHYAAP